MRGRVLPGPRRRRAARHCPRVSQPPLSRRTPSGTRFLGQPRDRARGRPSSATDRSPEDSGVGWAMSCDTQADVPSARRLRAQLAFKDSMVRGILQFTPSIAFRYVLHRCESRDIRCRESFRFSSWRRDASTAHRSRGDRALPFAF